VSGVSALPAADFSYTATGLDVTFNDLSSDPDGTIVSWSWDFGDGATSNAQNPSHTFPSSGLYDVLLTVADNDGATDTFGQQVVVSNGSGALQMYVADLSGESTPDGNGIWKAEVTILVLDEVGDPVANATISGSWSKGFYASSSCTTDASGQCMVEQTGIDNKTRRVTFTVDGVSHSALTYNAALNVVSTIRVDRP
jgi:PKD repeat protein